ncbi:MAG TPA: ligase-associated DNA damage response exonuclease [Bryobacteraceae bacterium]|nr:ligase-associated DNA damage response exonuclease [Bryobacteraceae bacterium]
MNERVARCVTYTEIILEPTDNGLYCPAGDFFVDPGRPVDRAVITHAHSDHACPGSRAYLTARSGEALLRARVGDEAAIQTVEYGECVRLNGVRVSFAPAGHILGSAQVRIESGGEVWVVSGDYKLEADPTCAPFEPAACDTFVTESTFGLPIFRWPPEARVLAEIRSWWNANQQAGKASVLFAYSLGKAQRVLAGLNTEDAPIYTHGAVEYFCRLYRAAGIALPPTMHAGSAPATTDWSRALILAPPSANGTPWMRRFGPLSTGFVSGWMRVRGARRRRSLDRGFVLSDHADWPGLMSAIRSSGASRVWVTEGYRVPVAEWLKQQGLDALPVDTRFDSEQDETGADPAEAEP